MCACLCVCACVLVRVRVWGDGWVGGVKRFTIALGDGMLIAKERQTLSTTNDDCQPAFFDTVFNRLMTLQAPTSCCSLQ